jgi:hypothetical protein
MSTQDARYEAAQQDRIKARSRRAYEDAPRGSGWLVFAGTMLLILGTVNVIEGIAAISNSKFFVNEAKFVIGSLNAYGWIILLLGATQLMAALGVLAGSRGAAWAGVAFAGLNAIAQLLWISSYPFLALALFSLDVLVIYGLVVYGGRVDD